MLNAKDFNRKKFDDNWLGIVLPQSSQERQMTGFGGYAIRRKVAIMGHTPSNRGEIDDKDVVFAIVVISGADGSGAGGIKRTPRILQGDVVYGTFLDKDTKQQPIILGVLGRTGNVKYEKGVYGRYDITTGFVGSIQPLKLLGRGQTNEDDRDCTPLSIPVPDNNRTNSKDLSEKGGVPTEPTVGAIPPPPTDEETEVDPNIDEKIKNAQNKVNNLEDKKNAFDAQESASEGSTDREEYKENEQKLDDAKNEVNSLKNDKNKAANNKITDGGNGGDKKQSPTYEIPFNPGQDSYTGPLERTDDPSGSEPDFKNNRDAWNEWNEKESQKLKDDPDSSGLDIF